MPRYLKQKDNHSCGPIALMNVARWAGSKIKYKDLPAVQDLCDCDPKSKRGTTAVNLHYILNTIPNIKSNYSYIPYINIKSVNNWIDDKNIILLRYDICYKHNWHGHFTVITGRNSSAYLLQNDCPSTMGRDRLRYHLTPNHNMRRTEAWFISRK
jgi:hypothetical protein